MGISPANAVWGGGAKILGAPKHKLHAPAVKTSFVPPPIPKKLHFTHLALVASIARTSLTVPTAPPQLLAAMEASIAPQCAVLIKSGSKFGLSTVFKNLIDTERSHFASRIGCGVADLCMNDLGYAWRANAAEILDSSKAHADFVYSGGRAQGRDIVLTEAHGSFAASVSAPKIKAKASDKYDLQVRGHVGTSSKLWSIVHGYSVAFGCRPNTSGAFWAISETDSSPKATARRRGRLAPPQREEEVDFALALPTFRSNLCLIGAWNAVRWIDYLSRKTTEKPTDADELFFRFKFNGESYLCGSDKRYCWDWWEGGLRPGPTFALHEEACRIFLKQVAGRVTGVARRRRRTFSLRRVPIVGFSSTEPESEDEWASIARFPDGLALIDRADIGFEDEYIWSPADGGDLMRL